MSGWGALWLLGLLLPAAPPQPSGMGNPYAAVQGRLVTEVKLQVPPPHKLAELRPLIDITPGSLLDPADVQAALVRLFALDRFAQVEVFDLPKTPSTDGTEGVGLLFVLTPKARLHRLHLTGEVGVKGEALLRALRVSIGDEVDANTASKLQRRALAHLRQAGFADAQVQVQTHGIQLSGSIDLVLSVDAGRPRRLRQLRFTGRPRLPAAVLGELIGSAVGEPASLRQLQEDRQTLLRTFRAHDFLLARVAPPQLHSRPDGDVDVDFYIDAGDRLAIDYVGNRLLTGAALRALLSQDSVLSLTAQLRLWRQGMVTAYTRRGYLTARVDLHQVFVAPGERRLVVHVDEGTPLQITAVQFRGNTALPSFLLEEQCRALLRKELGDEEAFAALRPIDQQLGSPQVYRAMAAPSPPTVPPEARYVPDLYAEAARQIAATYRDMGYLAVKVSQPTCHRDAPTGGEGARIDSGHLEFSIEEGLQTTLRSVGFAGNQRVAPQELFDVVLAATAERSFSAPLRPGLPLSQGGVEDGRIALVHHYRNLGFLYANVEVEVTSRQEQRSADVRFVVREGPQVRIARTLLRGNAFTRDGVIRSRIGLQPGDVYRLEQAIADQRSIADLGVFNSVRVRLVDEEHPAEHKDLIAEVAERRRQPIEVAPGISTAEGPRLRLSYAHLNVFGTATAATAALKVNRQIFFSLFGNYADTLTARYANYRGIHQLSRAVEHEARLGLRSPPIRRLVFDPVLRLDLVDLRVNAVRYSLDSETLVLGADLRLPGRFKATLETQLGLVDLECDPNIEPNCNLTPEVRHLEGRPIDVGNLWMWSGGPLFIWDRRDNPLNPRRGMLARLRVAVARGGASPFASGQLRPFSFIKYDVNLTGYVGVGPAVLALSARGGLIDRWLSQVPIDQRFFMGGRDSLRGFVEATLIPQDACVGSGPRPAGCAEQLAPGLSGSPSLSRGGHSYALLKTELRLPLSDALALSLFVDAGNLWIDLLAPQPFVVRLGVGAGLRYATPVGAMALDLGVNPMPRAQFMEPSTQLHFSLGTF